jgi:hypothetical protein
MSCVNGSQKRAMRSGRLHLGRIVWARRTAAEDRQYHIEAEIEFRKFAELIVEAKRISNILGTGHYCSQPVRELREALYKAQIAEAEDKLQDMRSCADALEVAGRARTIHSDLANATAAYLGINLSDGFTIDDLVRWSRRQ